MVAGVAAYASYVHQHEFALQGGADATGAALWPLSVDGLLLLATAGLLNPSDSGSGRRGRVVASLAFGLGIAVSLAANVAAAPSLAWRPVLVAGWPPVALLLAVELLVHRPARPVAVHRPGDGAWSKTRHGRQPGPDDAPSVRRAARPVRGEDRPSGSEETSLLQRAREADARHRERYQRPISAETLRVQLGIGATRSRELVSLVRADQNGRRGADPS
ncbi:DUF2637 domain-containing protein [Streptomyces phytophilus]|uniref:DUF2637 domain-containing protein n=1 Tax=Streptomyces phytophilus TaxID=722715 RepID=UPI002867CEAB|nr:DUF2637 domain-containing protein [Streptomyces phytophilus]